MKSLIYTDIHWGVRKNSLHFLENTKKIVNELILPTIDQHDIKHVINIGDTFHDQLELDVYVIASAKSTYYDAIRARGVVEDNIVGNHDCYFRHTNAINSPEVVLKEYIEAGTLNVYTETTEVGDCIYVPWINKENEAKTFDTIAQSNKKYCFGHLELIGFKHNKISDATHGHDRAAFQKFLLTCSGHFHFPSQQGQIRYLGSTNEHNWQDAGDTKGIYIFDHESGELTFVHNPFTLHEVVTYNDKHDKDAIERCAGKFVKLYYGDITKQSAFDKFLQEIEKVAIKVTIIRSSLVEKIAKFEETVQESVEVEDTSSLLKSSTENQSVVEELFRLYNRAQAVKQNG